MRRERRRRGGCVSTVPPVAVSAAARPALWLGASGGPTFPGALLADKE